MSDDQESKLIPPAAIIIDAISNIIGANVTGHSKRTQYYLFMDMARGNSLQQPYQLWFTRQILEPLEKTEKGAIAQCFQGTQELRQYRGILIDDAEKAALAESRFALCKGRFEELHKETSMFRAYFILDRVVKKYAVSPDKLNAVPKVAQLVNREFDQIFQAYDETLLDTPNVVENRLQESLATILSKPLYGAYLALDILLYIVFGMSAQYPDLPPRQGFSLRLAPKTTPKLVGLGPLSERQAANIATWLTENSFSKVKDVITDNGKAIFNNATAIALGALLSATIVTRFYTPDVPAIDPAFLEAIKGAKFDLFAFRNGDLGIVTYEMPQIPERMRYGDVCRISWRDVNRSLQRNHTGNMMDLADLQCQEGFLSDPLKAFYDERSQDFIGSLTDVDETSLDEEEEVLKPLDTPMLEDSPLQTPDGMN